MTFAGSAFPSSTQSHHSVNKSSSSSHWFDMICKCSPKDISLAEKKSSHNFLHNRIVTFPHCVLSVGRKVFCLHEVIATSLESSIASTPFTYPPSTFAPPMNISSIRFPQHLPTLAQCRCDVPAHHFLCERFFGYFINSIDIITKNCRRILVWNFNLIHIIATRTFLPDQLSLNLLHAILDSHHSQANSSIFVQSHTADFINCTTSASVSTSAPTHPKRIESNIGRWEPGSIIEPLQIHLPPANYTTATAIKTEKHHSGSSTSSTSSSSSSKNPSSTSKRAAKAAKSNKTINDCILNLHQQHQSKTTYTSEPAKIETIGTGCSRTLPLTWNQALQQLQSNVNTSCISSYGNCPSADTTTYTTAALLQIKREPCQVSEVTTSNNLIATTSFSGTPALIKIEQKSPTTSSSATLASITSSMDSASNNNNTSGGQQNNGEFKNTWVRARSVEKKGSDFSKTTVKAIWLLIVIPSLNAWTAGAAIPIGIAVGRQRLQEATNQTLPQLQSKDLNRFGLGLAELGKSIHYIMF